MITGLKDLSTNRVILNSVVSCDVIGDKTEVITNAPLTIDTSKNMDRFIENLGTHNHFHSI